MLRVEDLDRGRVRPGVQQQQLDELRWLGLDWDEGPDVGGPFGPYVQRERQGLYTVALERLAERELLYACRCTRREIAEAASAPHAGEEGPRYGGTCRVERVDPRGLPAAGVALRFRVGEEAVRFRDLLQGPQEFHPATETGDFVVRRKDGVAAYQLAVTVDDAAMRITHVVRGADLLPSTARQLLLYRALALPPPAWVHVPLLLAPGEERLAKRRGAPSLGELRGAGVRPQAVVGILAASCGLAETGEEMAPAELIGRFDLAALPRVPSVLDAERVAGGVRGI